jgi:hypothetical protein
LVSGAVCVLEELLEPHPASRTEVAARTIPRTILF